MAGSQQVGAGPCSGRKVLELLLWTGKKEVVSFLAASTTSTFPIVDTLKKNPFLSIFWFRLKNELSKAECLESSVDGIENIRVLLENICMYVQSQKRFMVSAVPNALTVFLMYAFLLAA